MSPEQMSDEARARKSAVPEWLRGFMPAESTAAGQSPLEQLASANQPAISGAPLESYPADDQAFYRFWYGHMQSDLMQPPLSNVDHATARYIWDAARATK